MGKKKEAAEAAEVETAETSKKKAGFVKKSLRKIVLLGAVGGVAKYFADSGKGGERRKKVTGLVNKAKPGPKA